MSRLDERHRSRSRSRSRNHRRKRRSSEQSRSPSSTRYEKYRFRGGGKYTNARFQSSCRRHRSVDRRRSRSRSSTSSLRSRLNSKKSPSTGSNPKSNTPLDKFELSSLTAAKPNTSSSTSSHTDSSLCSASFSLPVVVSSTESDVSIGECDKSKTDIESKQVAEVLSATKLKKKSKFSDHPPWTISTLTSLSCGNSSSSLSGTSVTSTIQISGKSEPLISAFIPPLSIKPLCRFAHQQGGCKKPYCKFSHRLDSVKTPIAKTTTVTPEIKNSSFCRDFRRGTCTRSSCRWRHDEAPGQAQVTPASFLTIEQQPAWPAFNIMPPLPQMFYPPPFLYPGLPSQPANIQMPLTGRWSLPAPAAPFELFPAM